jgi:hypothetical protein
MKPRDRIATHLQRILVAAGMTLPQAIHADNSVPDGNKGKKPPEEPKKPEGKKPEGKKPEGKKPRERLGYEVVDMLAEPYVDKQDQGTLELRTIPAGATVLIDGKDIGKKTPLSSWKLNPGIHAITLRSGSVTQNFTVVIKADQMVVETHDLRPSPAPETKK